MSSEWKSYQLGDLFDLVNGFAFKGGEFKASGIPVIKIKNVKPNNLLLSDLAFLDKDVADKRPDKELKRGDILITMSGNRMDGSRDTWVGKVAYFDIPGRYMLNQRVGVLRPKKGVEVDRKCCSYFLSSDEFQDFFIAVATSSGGQANLSPSQILGEKINLPPLAEQKQIASLLTSLDDRITLLRETNTTLEAIAQALFKSWFVDFDPVHAKMQGRPPEGMDEATAALFPDSFEDSELGPVPKGWNPTRLDSFIELAYGKALKSDSRRPGAVPVYGSGGITGWHDTALVNEASLVVGRKGTVGSIYWESRPFFPIDTVFYVKASKPLSYCHQLLMTLGLNDMNTDAAVPGLNRENVYRLQVPDAPSTVTAAFDEIVSVLRCSIDRNSDQVQALSEVRDVLLPRLISGQLTLPSILDAVDA